MALDAYLSTLERQKFAEYPAASGLPAVRVIGADGNLIGGSSSSSAASVGGGNSTYSNIQGDFTATANSGTKTITLSAYANTILSASINVNNFLGATVKKITSGGVVTTLPMTTISFAANLLTLTDMTANFAVGDTVAVIVPGNDKEYDATNNAVFANMKTLIAGEDTTNNKMVVEQRNSFATITTATTTTIKAGSGFVHTITILGGTLGAITVYDNTAGSGTTIVPTVTPTATLPCPTILLDASFATGLTIVTAAATIIEVSYR